MSTNIINDIAQIYSQISESSHLETDMKKRRENNERAIEDMKNTKAHKDMVAAVRKKFDEGAKPDYLDFDKDGNKKESMKKALKDKEKVEEAKKPNDGNLANNYPPYDKVTRGDVIAGRLGKDEMGGKKKITKEGFSNWREDLYEIANETQSSIDQKQIKEKKVKNKIKINPDLGEAVEGLGGVLIEMIEMNELDGLVESVYDELLSEGYDEDDVENAIEYALTEAKVTMGHDTTTEKKRSGLLSTAKEKLSSVKASAKAAVARGARKVAKRALGVARKMEGGDNKPSAAHVKTRTSSTYRGAGAGTKEKVSSGSYTPPSKKKAEKPSDPWEGSATTPPKAKATTKKATAPKAKPKAKVATKKKKSNLDDLLASIRNEEIRLDEKALSRAQQRFMGMVYAAKKGETPASPEVAKAAAGISKKEARKFAKTKHEGLPEKKEMEEQQNMDPKANQLQKQQIALDRKKLQMKTQMVSKKQATPSTELITHEEFEIVDEGMTMKDFKQQRSRQKQKEKRAAEKTSPTRRANMSSYERAVRHRVSVDPDYDRDHEERDYPGGVTKNPKKIRKAKALGELGEENLNELNRAEKETGINTKTGKPTAKGGAKDDKAFTQVKKMIRKMEGTPAGQRKKVPGKKPPAAGAYGSGVKSPAQKVAQRRADRQRSQDMMHSRFD